MANDAPPAMSPGPNPTKGTSAAELLRASESALTAGNDDHALALVAAYLERQVTARGVRVLISALRGRNEVLLQKALLAWLAEISDRPTRLEVALSARLADQPALHAALEAIVARARQKSAEAPEASPIAVPQEPPKPSELRGLQHLAQLAFESWAGPDIDRIKTAVSRVARLGSAAELDIVLVAAEKALKGVDPDALIWCLRQAAKASPTYRPYKKLGIALYRRQHYHAALRYLNEARALEPETFQQDRLAVNARANCSAVLALEKELRSLVLREPSTAPSSGAGKVAYLAFNTLPFASGGYATRTQGLCRSLLNGGIDLTVVVRPGFPLDSIAGAALPDPPKLEVDGVPYVFSEAPNRQLAIFDYFRKAASYYERLISTPEIGIVHAASNFYVGLPASLAARRADKRFIYEVRGFWEITRASRDPDFRESPLYRRNVALESITSLLADHVFTLTEEMKREMVGRGVPEARITLAPNAVDVERFKPVPKDLELARALGIASEDSVIGYVGSFVDYEGLDDLVVVFAELRRSGHRAKLLLVGDDKPGGGNTIPIARLVGEMAEAEGVASDVILTGRVPHDEAERYYGLIDIAPFPRKPWPVCEMVSPMKPLEALAMEKAVVISSVGGMKDMVQHGRTGLVFEKGNNASLRDALLDLLSHPEKRVALGQAGRAWAAAERSWQAVARHVIRVYDELRTQPPAPVDAKLMESLLRDVLLKGPETPDPN